VSQCEVCGASRQIFLINGRGFCPQHLDDGLQLAALPLRKLLSLLGVKR
jgi:hypothetical protein